jgi:hypothetical protein
MRLPAGWARLGLGSACVLGAVAVAAGSPILWIDAWIGEVSDAQRATGEILVIVGTLLLAVAFVGLYVVERGGLLLAGILVCTLGIPFLLFGGFLLVPLGLVLFAAGLVRRDRSLRYPGALFAGSVLAGLGAWAALEAVSGAGQYATLVFLALHCASWAWLGGALFASPRR